MATGRSLKREHQNFNANELPSDKQAEEQVDIKAKDAQNDIVWNTTRDFHPKSFENPKVHWDMSNQVL